MATLAQTIAAPQPVLTQKQRISSIDLMRGIVMVIMALDHVRDFFHLGGFSYNATDLQTTTPVLFFTRWITHYCAPTFVFLAGTSIYLSLQRKSKKDLALFLVTRGLWLIALELVVIRFSFFFNFYYDVTVMQVIWVIGASMICMAGLIFLPFRAILATGLIISFGHNLTDSLQITPQHPFYGFWSIVRQTGFLSLSENNALLVMYPLLPWLGIMVLGFCLGKLYTSDTVVEKRQKILIQLGLLSVILFLIIRLINVYGDPAPWSVQKNGLYTLMSFVNTTKYPVSLLYTLMTLGPVLILLSFMEKVNMQWLKPLTVFGRVPLFYYILHFYLIHIVSLLLYLNKSGKSWSDLDFHFNRSFGGLTPDAGYSLVWVYVAWIAIVLSLYPLCKWYNEYKSRHSSWWLSYL